MGKQQNPPKEQVKNLEHVEFIELNPDNCQREYKLKTCIARLNVSKGGNFWINKFAADKIGLVAGDKVVFKQSKADRENWYLVSLGQSGNGFEVKVAKRDGSYQFNNGTLIRKLCESFELKDREGLRFLVGEPTVIKRETFWGLLKLPNK